MTEIDLADLLHRLCRQWKWIVVCALVGAMLLGGYGLLKSKDDPDLQEVEEDVALAESELTEAEEQAVADAVQLEHEIRGLEWYLDNSILMQLDTYHKARYVMLYRIDRAGRQELPGITESYLNFLLNGGAVDALAGYSGWEIDKSCLSELISAYQKIYSSPYQIVADSQSDSVQTAESLFYVEIIGKDAGTAQKMAQDMQDVIREYSARIRKAAGSHRLALVSSVESISADGGLQSQQHEKKSTLSSYKTSLKTMMDTFSNLQMEVYEEAAGVEIEDGQEESEKAASDENMQGEDFVSSLKYILFGFISGIFIYCGIFSCWYIFSDTLKSTEEMKRMYMFPVYGGILPEARDGKGQGSVPGMKHDTYGYTEEQVLNRIRLACRKQGVAKLCAASAFPLDEPESKCLEDMAGQLSEWKIDMETAENVSVNTSVWDRLVENGNVLMVFRTGTTTHQMVNDAINFYLENGIAVVGAMVFLKDR